MIFELLGALIDKEFFWAGVGKVAEAGIKTGSAINEDIVEPYREAKKADEEEQLRKLVEKMRAHTFIPDTDDNSTILAESLDHGRLATPWSVIRNHVLSDAYVPNDYSPETSHFRKSDDGKHWLLGQIEDSKIFFFEVNVFDHAVVVLLAVNRDEMWACSSAAITPQDPQQDSFCNVEFCTSIWSVGQQSWSDVLFGPSAQDLQTTCDEGLAEFRSMIFLDLDKIGKTTPNISEDLERLAKLKSDGHLSVAEFEAAKKQLLAEKR